MQYWTLPSQKAESFIFSCLEGEFPVRMNLFVVCFTYKPFY